MNNVQNIFKLLHTQNNVKMQQAKFIAPSTLIDRSFWEKLYDMKLNVYKLDNSEKEIYYNEIFNHASFDTNGDEKCFLFIVDDLKNTNKIEIIESKREYLLIIKDKNFIKKINTKIILTSVDLKSQSFKYIICYPTLVPITTHFEFEEFYLTSSVEEINLTNFENLFELFDTNKYCNLNYIATKSPDGNWTFEWKLRNFLALLSYNTTLKNSTVNIMMKTNFSKNVLFKFKINKYSETEFKMIGISEMKEYKLTPQLNNSVYTKDSNNLNLKLMKWNMWQTLNLEKIEKTKCLILGAGTLGCNISRLLIGWGFKNLTFVDNGKVTYSTPPRQSMYEINDIGKFKVDVITEKILKINSSLNCKAHSISILCPDHPIIDKSTEPIQLKEYNILKQLVDENDVIFTVTDDRESRWLPIVLTTGKNKIIINVALGFESYLVSKYDSNNSKNGCYFCNDILHVSNSHINRSEDQKCTITRPGISSIASGLAVEMLINFLHDNCLEVEQIRGNVSSYEINCMKSEKSDYCVACSNVVKNEYLKHEYEFIKKVCLNGMYLDTLCGISKYLEKANYEQNIDDDF